MNSINNIDPKGKKMYNNIMSENLSNNESNYVPLDFIREIIRDTLRDGVYDSVHTRFPPEPNGYLHIGHIKSICLNFGVAEEYGGLCNLRFDDTNPTKEEDEYVQAIKEDIKWLGFDYGERMYYASDYFDQLFEWAIKLIKDGKAYVDDLTPEEMRAHRGTLTEPGKDSPYRERTVEENLDLFYKMKEGIFEDGSKTLRAKIDMSSPNINMRDPVMYRVLHANHHRTGDKWSIYPMYDFAHGQGDSIEGISHSICTLEFEDHKPLYNWFLENLGIHRPMQIEFARFNMTYTLLSKRKLLQLVNEKIVDGWDDPRMPTIAGIRRRGYTKDAMRKMVKEIGISKNDSVIDITVMENAVREDLNYSAQRVMAVLDPIKVVITNYDENLVEELDAINNPEKPEEGTRKVPFSRELYIEREDFAEVPPPKFFRLTPGREVRLRYAYFITCNEVIKNEQGEVTEIHCTYDPATKGGDSPDGRKVKATLHWVSAKNAVDIECRLYDYLFNTPDPNSVQEGQTFLDNINENSLVTVMGKAEPFLKNAAKGDNFQFERVGYFVADSKDFSAEKRVFNRIVTLKDTFKKQVKG